MGRLELGQRCWCVDLPFQWYYRLIWSIALIPPSSFMQVLPRLPAHTDPIIKMRTFTSGLKVLHALWYVHQEFSERLLVLLEAAGPKTLLEVAE